MRWLIPQIKPFEFFHLPKGSAPSENDLQGTSFTQCEDLEALSHMAIKDRLSVFKARQNEGHRCYILQKEDADIILGYFWLSVGAETINKAQFKNNISVFLDDQDAYIWDCKIDEQHRNQGLYKIGLKHCQKIFGSDFDVWICCEKKNIPSLRAIKSVGFQYAHRAYFVRVLKACFVLRGFKCYFKSLPVKREV